MLILDFTSFNAPKYTHFMVLNYFRLQNVSILLMINYTDKNNYYWEVFSTFLKLHFISSLKDQNNLQNTKVNKKKKRKVNY